MNNVERMFVEQMENEKFQKAVFDDFTFVDSLIDQRDLDKLSEKEGNNNASDD